MENSAEFYQQLYQSQLCQRRIKQQYHLGYHPIDPTVQNYASECPSTPARANSKYSTDEHQHQLYYELLKLGSPYLQQTAKFRTLDFGCRLGGGVFFVHQIFPKLNVHGLDSSKEAIKLCQQTPEINSRFSCRSLTQVNPIPSRRFHLILAVELSLHFSPGSVSAEELRQVLCSYLEPDGILVIAEYAYPNEQDYPSQWKQEQQSPLKLLQEVDCSFHVAMACKYTTPLYTEMLLKQCPENDEKFRSQLEQVLVLKHTPIYEALRLNELHYNLYCFQHKPTAIDLYYLPNQHQEEEEEEEEEEDLTPNFYDYQLICPELQILIDNFDILEKEMRQAIQHDWPDWPEQHFREDTGEWKVFPFCYTFPGDDPTKTVWVDKTCALCPETIRIIRQIPNLRTALYSRLGPKTEIGAHTGWADLSNHVLRCHLGLDVPTRTSPSSEETPVCGMIVNDEERYHGTKQLLIFDDSKLHRAYNDSDEDRIVLLVDIFRPSHLPRGKAKGGHTEELDKFISSFGL